MAKKKTTKVKKAIKKGKVKKKTRKEAKKEAKKVKIRKKTTKTERVTKKPTRYFEAVGRRKTATARVRLFTQGEKVFLINERPLEVYFPLTEFQNKAKDPLLRMKCQDKFKVSVLVRGGGFNAQSEAVRHGIAKALVIFNPDFRKRLKKAGFLTRDPRMRERKKFGLKRARRAPQWQKR